MQLSRCYLITQITSRKLQSKITFAEPFLKLSYNLTYYMYPLSSLNCNLNDMQELTKLYTVWYMYLAVDQKALWHSLHIHNATMKCIMHFRQLNVLTAKLVYRVYQVDYNETLFHLYDQKPKIIILAPMQ